MSFQVKHDLSLFNLNCCLHYAPWCSYCATAFKEVFLCRDCHGEADRGRERETERGEVQE